MALIFVCLVAAATWLPGLRDPIDLRVDGAAYFMLGCSLAHGTGYRLLNQPGKIESVPQPRLLPGCRWEHLATGS